MRPQRALASPRGYGLHPVSKTTAPRIRFRAGSMVSRWNHQGTLSRLGESFTGSDIAQTLGYALLPCQD